MVHIALSCRWSRHYLCYSAYTLSSTGASVISCRQLPPHLSSPAAGIEHVVESRQIIAAARPDRGGTRGEDGAEVTENSAPAACSVP